MNLEELTKLDGKVFCVEDGQRVPVTKIDLVEESRAGNISVWLLEIGGVATHYLVNPADANDGAEKLPEPVACKQTVVVDKEDAQVFLNSVNKHFGLTGDDTLVDDGLWLERFLEDGEDSIVSKIKDKGAYFKAKLKNNADKAQQFGNTPFFFSFWNAPERLAATKENFKMVLAKLKAKKEEEERKAREAEEALA